MLASQFRQGQRLFPNERMLLADDHLEVFLDDSFARQSIVHRRSHKSHINHAFAQSVILARRVNVVKLEFDRWEISGMFGYCRVDVLSQPHTDADPYHTGLSLRG